MENPNYYAILTADVRYDEELCPMEKILYSEISALSNRNGYCNATNKYFVELYKSHKDTVSRWINNLKKQGHVKIEMIYKNKRVIERRIYPIGKNADRYRQNCRGGIGKNAEENIININNNKKEEEKDKLIEFYNNNIGMITQYIAENIDTYLEDGIEAELILTGMQEAVNNNARRWNYVKAILDNCLKDNIYTKEQYLIKQREFKQTNKNNQGPKTAKQEVNYNTDFSEYDKYMKRSDENG